MKDFLIFVIFYGAFTTAMYQLTHHQSKTKKPTISSGQSEVSCVNKKPNSNTTSREVI